MSRTYLAYLEAAKAFAWFDEQFGSFTYEQLVRIEAGLTGEQKAIYGMLRRTRDWRMKFEDPDVLKACGRDWNEEEL